MQGLRKHRLNLGVQKNRFRSSEKYSRKKRKKRKKKKVISRHSIRIHVHDNDKTFVTMQQQSTIVKNECMCEICRLLNRIKILMTSEHKGNDWCFFTRVPRVRTCKFESL